MTLLKRVEQASKSGSPAPRPVVEKKSVKQVVFERLLGDEGPTPDWPDEASLRRKARPLVKAALAEQDAGALEPARKTLLDEIVEELQRFGPLALWLEDVYIHEIMVVNHEKVFVTNKGRRLLSPLRFRDEAHLRQAIDYLLAPLHIQLNETRQLFAGRVAEDEFSDHYLRVSAAIPPLAVDGSTLTIRKFGGWLLTVQNVIDYGSATVEMMEYLRACVIAGSNILVSGDEGSGRTTLLNILSGFIPSDERIVTVEQFTQLKLKQEHVIRLEAPHAATAGAGDTSLRDLLRHALSMQPDRVVLGELRGGETLDFLLAMSSGQSGSMGTLRAKSPRDALARLETLGQMAGADWNLSVLRDVIASDLNLIVHVERLRDGTRKILRISEIQGLAKGEVRLADIFEFEQTGHDNRKILGRFRAATVPPKNLMPIRDAGIRLWQLVYAIKPENAAKFGDRLWRFYAAFPASVTVGETAILHVSVGPVDESTGDEPVSHTFPTNPNTGQPEQIELKCYVGASSFNIDGNQQMLSVNPMGMPVTAEFMLTAQKEGATGVYVSADRAQDDLGHLWLETMVTPPRKAPPTGEGETVSGAILFTVNEAESSFRPWYET